MTTTQRIEMIDTFATDISAARLTCTRASTGTDDELTVIWHSGRVFCDPFDQTHSSNMVGLNIYDSSGLGDWIHVDGAQCNACGSYFTTRSTLYNEHLTNATIQRRAAEMRDLVDERRDELRAARRNALMEDLDVAITDGEFSYDPRVPGVFRDGDGQVTAWDYDPWLEGAVIEVHGWT